MLSSNLESWENAKAVTMPRCAFLIIVWTRKLVEFTSSTSPWVIPLSINHKKLEYLNIKELAKWDQGRQINSGDSVHCKKLSIRWDIEGRNWFTGYMLWAHSLPWACVPSHNTCTFVYVTRYLGWLIENNKGQREHEKLAFLYEYSPVIAAI